MTILSDNSKKTVRLVLRYAAQKPKTIVIMMLANLAAGLMEAGTFGLIAVAISVLAEELEAQQISSHLENLGISGQFFLAQDKSGWFVLLVCAAIALQVFKSGLEYLGSISAIRLTVSTSKNLQEVITDKIMSLRYQDIRRYSPGSLGALLSQGDTVAQKLITRIFNSGFLGVILLVVYAWLLYSMSVKLTFIALLVVAIFSFCLKGIVKKLRILGEKNTRGLLMLGKIVVEYLSAARLIRLLNVQTYAKEIVNSRRLVVLNATERSAKIEAAIGPGTQVLTIFGIGVFLLSGHYLFGDGAVDFAPQALVFMIILQRIMHPVRSINDCRMTFANIQESLNTIGELMSIESELVETVDNSCQLIPQNTIEFCNVSFCYPGAIQNAVTDVSFSFRFGEAVALVGPSGAGKTTISDLLLRLYQPTQGHILIDGIDLQDVNKSKWLESIGVVDQEVFLFNSSVSENIAFGQSVINQEQVESVAHIAQAHHFISQMEDGYETIIGDRGSRLSGGQRQRLALARALYKNPSIILLDEATSALDSESEMLFKKSLEVLKENHTLFIISHRLASVSSVDQVIVFEHGRLIESGTIEDLLRKKGRFFEFWNLQQLEN